MHNEEWTISCCSRMPVDDSWNVVKPADAAPESLTNKHGSRVNEYEAIYGYAENDNPLSRKLESERKKRRVSLPVAGVPMTCIRSNRSSTLYFAYRSLGPIPKKRNLVVMYPQNANASIVFLVTKRKSSKLPSTEKRNPSPPPPLSKTHESNQWPYIKWYVAKH